MVSVAHSLTDAVAYSRQDSGDRRDENSDEACRCVEPDVSDLLDGPSCIGCGLSLNFPGEKDYTYVPLKLSNEIRLVRLLPSENRESNVRCIITHTKLSEGMDFEALSYVWGNNVLSSRIATDKGIVKITKNCLSALRDLRHTSASRLLWIDAICINQRSNEEKNHQVPLMSRIYATASQTLIYLGPQTNDKVLPVFEELQRYWRGDPRPTGPPRLYLRDVEEILSLPWFHRVWVLQELANSKKALLFWGSTSITWRIFSGTLQRLYSNRENILPPTLRMKDSDPNPFLELRVLLNFADHTHSSDPRDKVYALIGLLNTTVLHDIVPDYNKSVVEVNVDLVHSFVRLYNNLNILLFSVKKHKPIVTDGFLFLVKCELIITDGGDNPKDMMTVRDPEQSLPTWVPDLRYSETSSSRRTIPHNRTNRYDSFEGTVARPCTSEYHSHRGPALEVSLLRYIYVGKYFEENFKPHRRLWKTVTPSNVRPMYEHRQINGTDEVCLINGFYKMLVLRPVANQHASPFYQLIAEAGELGARGEFELTENPAGFARNKPVIRSPVTGKPIPWETACLV